MLDCFVILLVHLLCRRQAVGSFLLSHFCRLFVLFGSSVAAAAAAAVAADTLIYQGNIDMEQTHGLNVEVCM